MPFIGKWHICSTAVLTDFAFMKKLQLFYVYISLGLIAISLTYNIVQF